MRDLRQVWRFVFGRPFKQAVGDGDQRGSGEEEEAAVESGEPEAGGAAGQSQPGAVVQAGGVRRPSLASDAIAVLADGLDHRWVTELGAQPVDGGLHGGGERVGRLVPHSFEQFLRRHRLSFGNE